MSDQDCFAFLRSINSDRQAFIDKGWSKWRQVHGWAGGYWPESYEHVDPGEEYSGCWFPPGFKSRTDIRNRCCAHCTNSRSEVSYACRLPEMRVAEEILEPDSICPGHSYPVFSWEVKFSPYSVCDYFGARELTYNI